MRCSWDVADVVPGRVVGQPQRAERWMIGYIPSVGILAERYSVNSMSDGMVRAGFTKESLAAHLTATGAIPAELLKS